MLAELLVAILSVNGVAVLAEKTVGDLSGNTFDLPVNAFVTRLDEVSIFNKAGEVSRQRHIHKCLEEGEPGVECTFCGKEGSDYELVANVEHFANEVKNSEGGLVSLVTQKFVNQAAEDSE